MSKGIILSGRYSFVSLLAISAGEPQNVQMEAETVLSTTTRAPQELQTISCLSSSSSGISSSVPYSCSSFSIPSEPLISIVCGSKERPQFLQRSTSSLGSKKRFAPHEGHFFAFDEKTLTFPVLSSFKSGLSASNSLSTPSLPESLLNNEDMSLRGSFQTPILISPYLSIPWVNIAYLLIFVNNIRLCVQKIGRANV